MARIAITVEISYYSAFDAFPILGDILNGPITDINRPDLVWEHLSNPLLVGVPKGLRSIILDFQGSDTDFYSPRQKRSHGRRTRR